MDLIERAGQRLQKRIPKKPDARESAVERAGSLSMTGAAEADLPPSQELAGGMLVVDQDGVSDHQSQSYQSHTQS